LIHENDAARLHEFGEWVRSAFKENLARNAKASASHTRVGSGEHDASKTLDDDPESFWTTDDWQTSAEITYQLADPKRFNIAMLQEHLRSGQHIESVALDGWVDGAWRELGHSTTVGYKRLLSFSPVETDRVRLRIIDSRVRPTLATFGLFLEP
jgi:alpha-L-fucosidase